MFVEKFQKQFSKEIFCKPNMKRFLDGNKFQANSVLEHAIDYAQKP